MPSSKSLLVVIALSLGLVFILQETSAQIITAGEHPIEGFFVEFPEEMELSAPNPLNFSSDSAYLDLNDDGLDDVIIDLANNPGGVWYYKRHFEVIPLNGAEVAFGRWDSCIAICQPPQYVSFNRLSKGFEEGDVINSGRIWTEFPTYLSYSRWEANVPNGCGYGCGGAQFPNDGVAYLGVRLWKEQQSAYAWVKIKILTTAEGQHIYIGGYASTDFYGPTEPEVIPKRLIKIVDLLGREVRPEKYQLLLYIYDDGSVEKRVFGD